MIFLNFYFSQWHQHFGPLLIFLQWTPAGSHKLNQNVNFTPKTKQNLSVKMCTLKTQSCGDCNRLTIHWEKSCNLCNFWEKLNLCAMCVHRLQQKKGAFPNLRQWLTQFLFLREMCGSSNFGQKSFIQFFLREKSKNISGRNF